MTWARFDDGIYDHPKVIQAGRDARELFFASVVYSSRHLTDGVIPRGALRILQAWTEIDDPAACADRLIEVGLWESDGVNFRIHDFLVYQPSKEEVEERREVRAEAGRKGGMRSGEVRAQKAEARREANEAKREAFASENAKQNRSKREANHEANAKQNRTPSPSRPISPSEVIDDSRESSISTFVPAADADVDAQSGDALTDVEADTTLRERKRRDSEPLPANSEAMRLATLLRDRILSHTPDARVPDTSAKLQPWAHVVDLMLRLDRRAPPDVAAVIAFATTDNFWQANILSPGKLREKYDQLSIKRKQAAEGNGGNGNGRHAENGRHASAYTVGGGATPARRFTDEYYARYEREQQAQREAQQTTRRNG